MEYRGWPLYPAGEAPCYQSGPCICYTPAQIARVNAQPPPERADDRRRYMVPTKPPAKLETHNPPCVLCQSRTQRNGHTAAGVQLYRCTSGTCGHQQSEGSTAVTAGRPKRGFQDAISRDVEGHK